MRILPLPVLLLLLFACPPPPTIPPADDDDTTDDDDDTATDDDDSGATDDDDSGTTDDDDSGATDDDDDSAATDDDDSAGPVLFGCGSSLSCTLDAEYCRVMYPGQPAGSITYSCSSMPAACLPTPTCACLEGILGMGSAATCTQATSGALTLEIYGA